MKNIRFFKTNCMPVGTAITLSSKQYTVTKVEIAPDRKMVTYTATLFDPYSPGGVRDTRKLVKHADALPAFSKCA